MSTLGTASRAQELSGLLLSRSADGAFTVEDRAARAAVTLLALALVKADDTIELPRFLMEQIGAFAREAGLANATTVANDQRPAQLEAFLLAQLPPALKADLERFFREELAAGEGAAHKLAAALGLQRAAGPLDSGVRPAGTTAAGPLARFQLRDPPPKR